MLKNTHEEPGHCLNMDITFSLLVLRGILFPAEAFIPLGLEALSSFSII